MGGHLNLDGGTQNLDGGTLTLDGGTRPPYNLSTALSKVGTERVGQFNFSTGFLVLTI